MQETMYFWSLVLMYFVLFIVFIEPGFSQCPDFDILIRRLSLKKGFHRDVVTEIKWRGIPGCNHVVMEETLPSGMYIDVDQLRAAGNLSTSKVLDRGKVNIEWPAHLSQPQHILVYPSDLPPQSRGNHFHLSVKVPIHIRYHQPVPGKSFASLLLPPPDILIQCSDSGISERCKDRVVKAPCNEKDKEVCEWIHIPKESTIAESLEFTVPVGLMKYRPIVTIATALSAIGGTVWIMTFVIKYQN